MGRCGRVISVIASLGVVLSALVLAPRVAAAADAEPPPVPDAFQVEVTPTGFVPSTISVVVGQSVVFTNNSGATRSIVGNHGIFDSGNVPVGGAFTVSFPDNRTVEFLSTGSPSFGGTIQIGPNGFAGPAAAPIAEHLPDLPAGLEDPASFATAEPWGITASRTTIVVVFADTATVADGNRLLGAIHGRVSGRIGSTGILHVTIPMSADGSFDDLNAALATLRADPAVTAAALDPIGEEQRVPPGNPIPTFTWQTYPPTDLDNSRTFGLSQARVPQAWNLLDAIRRKGTDVQIGFSDSGYDLDHEEFYGEPGQPRRIQFIGQCPALGICFPNPAQGSDDRVHGTGTTSIAAGNRVGVNPLATMLVTTNHGTGTTGSNGTTFISGLNAVETLLGEKHEGGMAPNLRVINRSLGPVKFDHIDDRPELNRVWDEQFFDKLCGPGANDDAHGTEPCTPNNEDTFIVEIANLGKVTREIAEEAAEKDVLIAQAAGNESDAWCVPFSAPTNPLPGQPGCTKVKIRSDAIVDYSWAARHMNPATNSIVIVGAIGPYGARDAYSNVDADVSAGGQYVMAANQGPPNGGYRGFNGTSAATPFVAGLASMVSQYDPSLSAIEVRKLIIDHANPDPTDGAAPRIDAFATMTALPGALLDAADVNDPSADGNRRVVLPKDEPGAMIAPDYRFGTKVGNRELNDAADGTIDMRDFRRTRDAWLRGCQGAPGMVNCPAASIELDGGTASAKFDLNLDGCSTGAASPCKTPEDLYPRMDPAGTGRLGAGYEGRIGTDATGTPTAAGSEANNLAVLQMLWGKRSATGATPDLEGYTAAELPSLLYSADIEVHLDSLKQKGATTATVAAEISNDEGKTWQGVGKPHTASITDPLDGGIWLTAPLPNVAGSTMIRVGATATVAGKTIETLKPSLRVKPGYDMRIDPAVLTYEVAVEPATLAKGKTGKAKATLKADGKKIKKKKPAPSPDPLPRPGATTSAQGGATTAAADEPPLGLVDDGTAAVFGAPVEFTAEGTGTNPADPSVGTADDEIDDEGSASADIEAGDQGGGAQIESVVTVDGTEITASVDTQVSAPARLVYTWEQKITGWHRHFDGRVDPDPGSPGLEGTYDYDEDPPAGSLPITLKRTGSIDLDAATPTLDETVNAGEYSIKTTSPFGTGTETHSILAERRETKEYLLDRVRVDKDDTAATISGLRQVSDINYRYDCNQVNPSNCSVASRLHFFDSWLTITARRDVNTYRNGQTSGFRGGDGTSFLHAPDPDADLRIRKDSAGNWIPLTYCGSGDFAFPNLDGIFYDESGSGQQQTRFTATIVDEGGDPVLTLPDCDDPAPPTARIKVSPDPLKIGVPVTFTDDSTAPAGVAEWAWDFGDGTTSSDPSPDHLYSSTGSYPVKLTITDGKGRTATVGKTVTVNGGPPTGSIDDRTAQASAHVVLHGRIGSPSDFDRRSLKVEITSSAPGFPNQATRRLPAGPVDLDLGAVPAGTYPITMTVTDLAGQKATATATLVVIPTTPPAPPEPEPVEQPPVDGCGTAVTVPGEVDALITGLGTIRHQAGRLEVIASPTLMAAAERHAADLAAHPELVDLGSDGSTTASRAAAAGYPEDADVDQLVLRGVKLPADVLATWQTSTAKGEKLVDRRWTGIGAARAQVGSSWVWVVVLGEVIDCAPDDTTTAFAAIAAARAPDADPAAAPDAAGEPGSPEATPTSTPTVVDAVAPVHGAPTRSAAPAGASSAAGTAPAADDAFDLPAAAVPAFTIDDATPASGVTVLVRNRTMKDGTIAPATFRPDGERPGIELEAGAVRSTAWYSAGTSTATIKATATGVEARAAVTTSGATVNPAIAYTGPATAAQGATVVVTATVTTLGSGAPMAGRAVTFTVGAASATGTTGADGKVRTELVLPVGAPVGPTQLSAKALAVGPSAAATATAPFTITSNAPPVADAGGPYEAVLNTDLVLDGTGSSDPDGSNDLTYAWDLGGAGTFDADDGITPVFDKLDVERYLCGGTCLPDVAYPLALRVTDSLGSSTTDHTTVTLRRDFVLTITPPSTVLNPGATASYQVSVLTSSGFDQPVNLAVSGLPTGVTASIPPTAQPNTAVILSLTAAANAPQSSATITVTGTAGGLTRKIGSAVDLEFGLIPACTGAIEGTVTDRETGLPLANAIVARESLNIATTDANGHYRAENQPVGRTNQPVQYTFKFGKDGYWGVDSPQVIACNVTTRADASIVKKRTAEISGRITVGTRDLSDPHSKVVSTGVPIAGARVQVSHEVTTDADGRYREADISLTQDNGPNNIQIFAQATGYWPGRTDGFVRFTAAGPNVFDIALQKACYGDVYVKVLDSRTGLPVANSRVGINTPMPSGVPAPPLTPTGPDGIVHFTGIPIGVDNVPGNPSAGAIPPAGSNYNPNSQLGYFTIGECGGTALAVSYLTSPDPFYSYGYRVRVVDDATGAPMAGVNVIGNSNLTTDADGRAEWLNINFATRGQTTGTASVAVNTVPGYYPEQGSVTVRRDEVAELEIRMKKRKQATVTGTVRDAVTGEPLPGIKVRLNNTNDQPVTDANGRYSYTGDFLLPYNRPTPVTLWALGNDVYWDSDVGKDITVTAEGPNVADLVMAQRCAPGRISGTVRNAATKEPLDKASVTSGIGQPALTDANGRFTLENQKFPFDKPGPLDVTAFKSGFISATKRVTIYCGANIELNFGESTGTGSITGRVTKKSDGSPVAGVFVGSGYGGTATTDSQGRYTLAEAPLGDGGAPRDWTVSVVPAIASKLGKAEKTATVRSTGPATVDFELEEPTVSAPVDAVDDDYTVDALKPTTIPAATGVLANDSGVQLAAALTVLPSRGTVTLNADGSFTYTPTGSYLGDTTFKYAATGAGGRTDVATVTLHVKGPDAPVAVYDRVTTPYQTDLVVPAPGALANDTPAGGGLTVTYFTQPSKGTSSMTPDGAYTYSPPPGFSGEIGFSYTVADALGRQSTGLVIVTVGPPPPAVTYGIGDRVFRDLDGDGIQDQGEPNVTGVAVQLLGAQGSVLASTTTDAQGRYAFDGLVAGDYGVRFAAPAGFAFTAAGAGSDRGADSNPDAAGLVATFHLDQGANPRLEPVAADDPLFHQASFVDRTIDAGLVAKPGGIAVTVSARPAGSTGPFTTVAQTPWGEGFETHVEVVNTGDAPLSGVSVSAPGLTGCGRSIGTLGVGATSAYDCDGTTSPLKDTVASVYVAGSTPAGDAAASGPRASADEVSADASVTLQLTYSIGDRVWEDLDHDGTQDDGEPGIQGAAVALLDGSGDPLATTLTDEDGAYRFDGVRPGPHRIRFERSGAYRWTLAGVGSAATDSDAAAGSPSDATATSAAIAIADGQATPGSANPYALTVPTVDAGLWRPASITGTAFADADHDAHRDDGEAALSGIAVVLRAGDEAVARTQTANDGAYTFGDLVPGTYRVTWTVPDGYELPAGADGAGTSAPILVATGQAVLGIDIALWPAVVGPTTTTTTSTTSTTTTTAPTTTSTSTTTSTTSTTVPGSTTTSTTSTSTTTSTTVPGSTSTTSTTAAPTSTSTSTSVPGSTSSTAPAVVAPADTTPGTGPTGGPVPTGSSPLPRTGQDTLPLVLAGLAALGLGSVVLIARRRHRLRGAP